MAESENTFTFSQHDLMVCSFSVFCDMKNREELSDISIRIDQRVFAAHRIILAAVIPYFRAMFTSNLSESNAKEITMKELDPDALESLINFAYTSKVIITIKNVQSLLVASEFFQLTQVRDSCCDFISRRLDPNNVMQVRMLGESLNCLSLVGNADSYIRRNFDSFCRSGDFLNLSFSFLNELIRRDDLRVEGEEKVFSAALTWAKEDSKRHVFLPELLTGIRMTLLSPEFLIKKASTENVIRESFYCRNLLDEAKHYHLLPDERPSCSFALSQRCYETEEDIFLFCLNAFTGLTISKYSPETQELSTLLNDSMRNDVQHVVALKDMIYVFRSNSFESFNTVTLQWTPLANFISRGVPFKYAVPYGHKIYWLRNDSSESNLNVFNPEKNRWLNLDQLVNFSDAVLVSSRHHIYVLNSGYPTSSNNRSKIYNPLTGKVTEFASKSISSYSFSCASFENKIYACGGTSSIFGTGGRDIGVLALCEMYHPSAAQWLPIAPMNIGRKKFSLVSCKKKLFAFGGITENGLFNNIIESYDPKTDNWMVAGEISDDYDFVHAVMTSTSNE